MNRTILYAACALALLAAVACSDSPSDPGDRVGIRLEGRTERGSVLRVSASTPGGSIPGDSVTWTAQPATAVQFISPTEARLLQTGTVRFIATGRRSTGDLTVTITAPPRVVFTRGLANAKDIWAVDLDGANLLRLTTDQFDDELPSVTGSTVYFRSGRVTPSAIFRVPLTGGPAERVTTDAGFYADAVISPDGSRLIFARTVAGFPKLFVNTPPGGSATRLVTSASFADGLEGAPAWSPDGRTVAFVSTANGNADIYTTEIGGSPRRITDNAVNDVSPSWSPDGTRLVFTRGGSTGSQLIIADVATRATQTLLSLPGTISSPSWLPGDRILYVYGMPQNSELFWTDTFLTGSTVRVETGGVPVSTPAIVRN